MITCNDIERDTANLYNNVTLERKARKNQDAVKIILFKIMIYRTSLYLYEKRININVF